MEPDEIRMRCLELVMPACLANGDLSNPDGLTGIIDLIDVLARYVVTGSTVTKSEP
jgi:hypothetical protein